MTETSIKQLKQWIAEMADMLEHNDEPSLQDSAYFLQEPSLAMSLVAIIDALDDTEVEENRSYYSACVFALDVCVAQWQIAKEAGNKLADKVMDQLMSALADVIVKRQHSLSFWLPILNAFYEVHVDLSEPLKEAYLDLAYEDDDEDELTPDEELTHLNSIRDLIEELSDLSVFDIAENFFAQSYAMPADFFIDLVMDLYSIEEGHDIAVLMLLHPKQDVRDVVVAAHEQVMPSITLSSASLSRLQIIKNWYPATYHEQFNGWIRQQRKKGVVFREEIKKPVKAMRIKASEVDGGGAQGIFIHFQKKRQHRLCGLLFKQSVGIKDAWVTPVISIDDISKYYDEAFDDSVTLREVDLSYLLMMTNHFLAETMSRGDVPDLHFLEIQEELHVSWQPCSLDVALIMEQMSVQISPFTEDVIQESFKRSKTWIKNKRFVESWYVENSKIDKLVNQCSSFVDGIKVCRFEESMQVVFAEELEKNRDRWLFHFIWIALWVKSKARKNEKIGQDSFLIAHAIYTGVPLRDIPIMHEICYQSVINSIETMQERRTYLN